MRPLQVWLPAIHPNLAFPELERDARRAFSEWRGEWVVWFIKTPGAAPGQRGAIARRLKRRTGGQDGIERPVRWREKGVPRLALPAEHWDEVRVFHIGENGGVVGPGARLVFPDGRVDGLLDAWLNAVVASYPAPDSFTYRFPSFRDGKVAYEERKFVLQPGPTLPIVRVEDDGGTVWLKWPPDGLPAPVSPDAETSEFYGPLERAEDGGYPLAVSRSNPEVRSLHLVNRWPTPIDAMLPSGGGLDEMFGQAWMRAIATQSATDPAGALRLARQLAGPYVTDGETTAYDAWFLPLALHNGEQAALYALERYGEKVPLAALRAGSVRDALRHEEVAAVLRQPVPIRRAWGVLGLMWALLLDRLEDGRAFVSCERCGRIVSGKRGKRFCGPEDNPACFRARRAADRRRERAAGGP